MKPVRIITGRAGQLLPEWKDAVREARAAGKPCVCIVPEQYTLQAELQLLDALKTPGLLNVEVLSPSRLKLRIWERGGHPALPPLNELGRMMAISCALQDVADRMEYYARSARQAGMPAKLAELLTELQRSDLTPEDLIRRGETYPSFVSSGAKLRDLGRIWLAYRQVIGGRFTDPQAQQREMCARLGTSGVLDGVSVFVYGFDMLQPPFCSLLTLAALRAEQVTVMMIADPGNSGDGHIFAAQKQSLSVLRTMLDETGIRSQRIISGRQVTGRDPALIHLERNLFSRHRQVMEEPTEAVELHTAPDPHSEALYAANTLRRWHQEGIAWREMAVAVPSGAQVEGMLSSILQASGIPCHMIRKDPVMRHGMCRMLSGSLRAVANGWRQQDMLNIASSGFSLLDTQQAMRLQSYAVTNGIDGNKWLAPFQRGNDAEEAEPLRKKLMEPLLILHDGLKQAATAEEALRGVFGLLRDTDAWRQMKEGEQRLRDMGLQEEADREAQVWKITMDLLDQLHALLQERKPSMRDLSALLDAGLEQSALNVLPPQGNAVSVGEAGHMMPATPRAMIVVGLQENITAVSGISLVTEEERAQLSEMSHTWVGLSHPTRTAKRFSDFYRTINQPSERLLLSCSASGTDGSALRESVLMNAAQRVLPRCLRTGGLSAAVDAPPLSPTLGLEGLAGRLRDLTGGPEELDPRWHEALSWLLHRPQWHDAAMRMLSGLMPSGVTSLTPAMARQLYRDSRVSISRLETYAGCPYSHFFTYGLKPTQEKAFEFDAIDRGNFYHTVMERFVNLVQELPGWPDVAQEEVAAVMTGVIRQIQMEDPDSWSLGPLAQDLLAQRDGDKLCRALLQAARAYRRHAWSNGFRCVGTEVTFGDGGAGSLPPLKLTLEDSSTVLLQGKIDRLDRMDRDGTPYMRVIDYKSSTRKLEASSLWSGAQLQLMLYLLAVTQGTEGSLPAGAFYVHVHDANVKLDELPDPDKPQELAQLVELRLDDASRFQGLVLAEPVVLGAMRAGQGGGELANMLNKDGSMRKGAAALPLQELQQVMEHSCRTAAHLASRAFSGCIDMDPRGTEERSPCTYCPNHDGCPKLGKLTLPDGSELRNMQELSARIREEQEE